MNQNNFKIVVDSSADLTEWKDFPFASAPLKIITNEKEYTDDINLDTEEMVNDLSKYRGRSSTSCPSPEDWLQAFGEGKQIFCITITSGLSGSYNSACIAKEEYEREHPDRVVHVIDSLSAGPELKLIAEKLKEGILAGHSFADLRKSIAEYTKKTALLFMLESMRNLANNGRVNPLVAKAAGLLGIRIVGKASEEGTLELLNKVPGEKRALTTLWETMKSMGHRGGKVRISHCQNEAAASTLKGLIMEEFKNASVEISPCRALCSFYAEKGGLLVGFERE